MTTIITPWQPGEPLHRGLRAFCDYCEADADEWEAVTIGRSTSILCASCKARMQAAYVRATEGTAGVNAAPIRTQDNNLET